MSIDDQGAAPVDSSESAILDAIGKRFNPPAPKAETPDAPEGEPQPDAQEEPQEAAPDAPDAPTEAPEGEEGQEETQPDLSSVKVPVTYKGDDGQDVTEELPLDEIRSGYMRAKDYTLKTQEVSKARAAIPQAVEQGVSEARNQYVTQLSQLHALVQQTVAPELANIDWQKLAQENPADYVAKSARAQQVQGILSTLSQQHEQAVKQANDAKRAAADAEALQSIEVLKTAIPNFSMEKYQGIMQGAVKEYGKYGLKLEEVAGITGSVPLLVLNDALAYRALMSKKPAVQTKIALAPVAIKPGASKTRAEASTARTAPLKAQLAKTGSLDDATALYAARRKG